MSTASKATSLMGKIVYQLRPPTRTTMAPCSRCHRPSPGGQLCANCLTDDLGRLLQNRGAAMRWLASTKQLTLDEATVLSFAHRLDTNP